MVHENRLLSVGPRDGKGSNLTLELPLFVFESPKAGETGSVQVMDFGFSASPPNDLSIDNPCIVSNKSWYPCNSKNLLAADKVNDFFSFVIYFFTNGMNASAFLSKSHDCLRSPNLSISSGMLSNDNKFGMV